MTYATKPRRAEAIQYDGTNAEEIIAFVGKDAFQVLDVLEVRGSGGIWKNLQSGDWVIRDLSDGWTHSTSQETFNRVWIQEEKENHG